MENLGIDIKLIVAQVVFFALFFYVFKKYMAKPYLKYVEDQKQKEEEKEKLLKELNEDTQALEIQKTELQKTQKKELVKVIEEAKADAEKVHQEIIEKANKEAKDIITKAKQQLDEEREHLQREIKSKIVEMSTLMVRKALQDYLSEEEQKNVTKRILNNLNQ